MNLVLYGLAGVLAVVASCMDKKSQDDAISQTESRQAERFDTLAFTSGIRSILHDQQGNYWFGSDQEGVARYDGKSFTYYNTADGLSGRQVISIQEEQSGRVWFGTSTGLCFFDGKQFVPVVRTEEVFLTKEDSRQYSPWETNASDLWFPGANNHELIRIKSGELFTVKNPFEIPNNKDPRDYGITGLSKGREGGLWIASYSGVVHYDGVNTIRIDDEAMNYDGDEMYIHVRSILEDSKGRLWIGNNGLGVLLREKDSVIHFSSELGLVRGEMSGARSPEGTLMHVFAIREDSQGNIWFGDRDTGAWRYDGKAMKNFPLNAALKTQHIWDIQEDREGNLLFASGDRGVYKFTGNGFDRVF